MCNGGGKRAEIFISEGWLLPRGLENNWICDLICSVFLSYFSVVCAYRCRRDGIPFPTASLCALTSPAVAESKIQRSDIQQHFLCNCYILKLHKLLLESLIMTWLHQYHVVGRMVPGKGGSKKDEETAVYRMRIFAPNTVVAKSRFWYFLRKLKRVKKANGEILAVNEIHENDISTVKNIGVWLRYKSRSDTVNMYKEYRDVSMTGAVEQMYMEMSGRHRARWSSIQVLKVQLVADEDVRRPNTLQFMNEDLKFPLPQVQPRASSKTKRATYLAKRPTTFVA